MNEQLKSKYIQYNKQRVKEKSSAKIIFVVISFVIFLVVEYFFPKSGADVLLYLVLLFGILILISLITGKDFVPFLSSIESSSKSGQILEEIIQEEVELGLVKDKKLSYTKSWIWQAILIVVCCLLMMGALASLVVLMLYGLFTDNIYLITVITASLYAIFSLILIGKYFYKARELYLDEKKALELKQDLDELLSLIEVAQKEPENMELMMQVLEKTQKHNEKFSAL